MEEQKFDLNKSIRIGLASKGWYRKDLAKKIGIHPQRLSEISRANSTSLKTLHNIANALGLKLSEFIALGE